MNRSECKAQKADKRSDLVIIMFGRFENHGNTEFTLNVPVKPDDNWEQKRDLNVSLEISLVGIT